MSLHPDVLERLRARLDAALLPATEAAVHWEPMVAPDGAELTPAQALAWRAHAVDAELGVLIEIAREPRSAWGIPDLRPVPLWVQAGAVAAGTALLLGQAFLGFLLLILWVKF